jgi:hypothetical protein
MDFFKAYEVESLPCLLSTFYMMMVLKCFDALPMLVSMELLNFMTLLAL